MTVIKNTRYIKDRWISKKYDAIAIRCKGKWVYYMRLDLAVHMETKARGPIFPKIFEEDIKKDLKENMKQSELEIPLRVSNIVMTGKIPTAHKLDFAKFIISLDSWFVINEETSPIVQKRYERQDGTTSKRTHHKCSITVSIWPSGAINIVGLRSTQEGEETLNKVIKEIQSAGIL